MPLRWREKLPCDIRMAYDERQGVDELWNALKIPLRADPVRLTGESVSPFDSISCDQVFPNLYLGGGLAATNKKYLKELGITHVLNTAMGTGCGRVNTDAKFYKGTKIKFLGFDMMDFPHVDISEHFDESAEFIDSALSSGGKVYVHCVMGISRSSTIVVAFLMLKRNFTASEALTLVRSRRAILPNDGFLRRLAILDIKLQKERSNLGAE